MDTIPQYVRLDTAAGPDASASGQAAPLRLLLPVDATERSRWSIAYVMSLQRCKTPIEAHLLFVAEPITNLHVLRFRTRADLAAFQRQYGQQQLDDAVAPLRRSGIPVRAHYREGNIAFEIVDCAEQAGCDRIVLPQPYPRWMRLLNGDVVRDVLDRSASVPVVTVDRHGVAQSDPSATAAETRRSA